MALKLLVLVRRWHRTTQSIKHTDRKDSYIARRKKNEDWGASGTKPAGFYHKHVLWNKPTLKAGIDDINKV